EDLLRALAEVWHPASLPIRLLATLDAETVSEDHPGRYRVARLRKVHEHMLETCFTSLDEQGLLREETDPAFAGRALLAMVLNLAVREKTVRPYQRPSRDDAPLVDLARQVDALLGAEADRPDDVAPRPGQGAGRPDREPPRASGEPRLSGPPTRESLLDRDELGLPVLDQEVEDGAHVLGPLVGDRILDHCGADVVGVGVPGGLGDAGMGRDAGDQHPVHAQVPQP